MIKQYLLLQEEDEKYYMKSRNAGDEIDHTIHPYKATRFIDREYAYQVKDELQCQTNKIYKVCEVIWTITVLE